MISRRPLAIILLIPFSVISIYALAEVGYMGIVNHLLFNPAGWQILADLVIALVLVLTWLIPDAQQNGRSPWPWVLMTVLLGSFGPLIYLSMAKRQRQAA